MPEGVQLELLRSERVLTWGRVAGGRIAAATDFGLRVTPPEDGTAGFHRWHEINRATWDGGHLAVEAMDGAVASYRLTEPRGLPVAVREHVNATIVVSEHHKMGAVGVRIVARRDFTTGRLVWSAVFDDPASADNPHTRDQAEALMAAVRRRFAG